MSKYCIDCKELKQITILPQTENNNAVSAWVCTKTGFIVDDVSHRNCDEPEYLKSLSIPFGAGIDVMD